MRRRTRAMALTGAVLALGMAACSTPAKTTARPKPKTLIGASTACGTETGKGCAPVAKRVDLTMPVFSNPTRITNPLFPISSVTQMIQLGTVEGKPFRAEVTLLPETKTIEWNGTKIETVVSQYTAYHDGRIEEIALDWYAQADDGSVWYFGEDVFNYADGRLADTEGTWITGKDGPAAMIMPAAPTVGHVYRPENSPGIVFEEVVVKTTGRTVQGPRGPVDGAITVTELHMDGTHEDKTFAPGYGEFFTGTDKDSEAAALAVPTDAIAGPVPPELTAITRTALAVFGDATRQDWPAAASHTGDIRSAWTAYETSGVPSLLRSQLRDALGRLDKAVASRSRTTAGHAALDVAYASLDLELRHRPPAEIDRERFGIWARRLQLDAASGRAGPVSGDVITLGWIRDRFAHTLPTGAVTAIRDALADAKAASDAKDMTGAARAAQRLLAALG